MQTSFIITATPELEKAAVRELQRLVADVTRVHGFAPGIFLIATERSQAEFIQAILQADPAFLKHMMPVQTEVALTSQRTTDLPAILGGALSVDPLAPGEPFSVQCRRMGPRCDYKAKDVEVFVGSRFERAGAVPVFSDSEVMTHPDQKVISVYLFDDRGYIGCSPVRENLNEHADEYRVLSRQSKVINRSELKLLEALRKFRLDVGTGRALDLGAAPGGWTRVLAKRGMEVVAVDPGALDERVAQLPTVTHIRGKAEEAADLGTFDLLVNDMNVDPEPSAAITVQMAAHLRAEAPAIMTAKLATRHPERLLAKVRSRLSAGYDVIRMQSLFHNRRELTVLLRKKSADAR